MTFEVVSQTLQNLQGSRRNTIQWCLKKLRGKRLRIDVWIDV